MNLFKVPGWNVSSGQDSHQKLSSSLQPGASKKRKRRPYNREKERIESAAVNIDRIMAVLSKGGSDKKNTKTAQKTRCGNEAPSGQATDKSSGEYTEARKARKKLKKDASPADCTAHNNFSQCHRSGDAKTGGKSQDEVKKAPASPQLDHRIDSLSHQSQLTSLQKGMKDSLEGARFRWINETLYKTDSGEAHTMMKNDPRIFEEYHIGFRHQVQSWPSNPVTHYINTLSAERPGTVVADLGCGEATLARALVSKGIAVISFDLISDGAYVVEADICEKIPLPGSESAGNERSEEAQIVDIVVCALALMGKNWVNCLNEAWRILKHGGQLKIAEVTSRFTDVDEFVSLVCSIGFRLKAKDTRNTHFTLFEFDKMSRKPKIEKEWNKLLSKGGVLKPCEYKRR